jgi:hypothetical protein
LIDLRFHIISLVAVFLALALGILLGSSVIQGALVDRLESDIRRYQEERDEAVEQAGELESENTVLSGRLLKDFGPWAVHQRLEGANFIVISEGPVPQWRDHVLGALEDAGAQAAGTIVLEERWALAAPQDRDELVRAVQEAVGASLPAGSAAGPAALALLGERFFDQPTGSELIDELESAGFISVPERPDGVWPAPGSLVVVLSASRPPEDVLLSGATSFVTGVAEDALAPGTLVVSDESGGSSLVTTLRDGGELPDNLATFDSATTDTDPGGVGVVAALVAATEGRGGHFGGEDGRTFVAPPSAED